MLSISFPIPLKEVPNTSLNYPELLPASPVPPGLSFGFARKEKQARKEELLVLVTSVEVSWIYKKT